MIMPIFLHSSLYCAVDKGRDTSSSLPKSNPVFRIFTTENKKRKMLTVDQFANNLKILLGKKKQRNSITLGDFQNALKC